METNYITILFIYLTTYIAMARYSCTVHDEYTMSTHVRLLDDNILNYVATYFARNNFVDPYSWHQIFDPAVIIAIIAKICKPWDLLHHVIMYKIVHIIEYVAYVMESEVKSYQELFFHCDT